MGERTTPVAPDAGAVEARGSHGIRKAVLIALIAAAVALVVQSLYVTTSAWPFRPFISAKEGLAGVLKRQEGQSVRFAMLVGLAVRDAAGGRVARLDVPSPVTALGEGQRVGEEQVRINASHLRQASGDALVAYGYDPVLTTEQIARLRREPGVTFVSYPMQVYGVIDREVYGQVILFTDERHEAVYALPTGLARRVADAP